MAIVCPCGGAEYARCCAPFHNGAASPDAQTLMKSRYSAYVLKFETYLLATWHPNTRPMRLDLAADTTKWLGLEVKHHLAIDMNHATVEFIARYKIAGKAHRLHEISRFVRIAGQWYYMDGDFPS